MAPNSNLRWLHNNGPCNEWTHLLFKWYMSLPSLCRLLRRHSLYKMLVRYILLSVCLRFSQSSQSFLCNIWGCVFSVYPIFLWWLWDFYLISIITSVASITSLCLRLGHKTIVCTSCLSTFLFLGCILLWHLSQTDHLPLVPEAGI